MRFEVRRTSQWNDDEPPCEGAVRATVYRWDRRTFLTPEEHDRSWHGEPWLDRGSDHGRWERNGQRGIQRRIESEGWTIEIATLEDLVAFSGEHGALVLDGSSIEIYDTYRE